MRNGELRLVRARLNKRKGAARGDVLLLAWSPPTHLRGIPLGEFMQLLRAARRDREPWEVPETVPEGGGLPRVLKGPQERDMYDVCHRIVDQTATPADCSFAERFCTYGPAQVMISHVWAEKIVNTSRAMDSLVNIFGSDWPSVRIWFCTTCNNQGRVKEEIGDDVGRSPFAQVLGSPYCVCMATVCPEVALTRKWCVYEYSRALRLGKDVWLATPEGVLQHGDVRPSYLKALAASVASLRCADAKCTSGVDAALIDRAVREHGGYDMMDTELKKALLAAIAKAQAYLDDAREGIWFVEP